MRAVNLLPADHKQVRQVNLGSSLGKHSVAIGGTAAAIAVAALLGVSWQSASKDAKTSQQQLDVLNARIAVVANPLKSGNQTVRERITQVSTADSTRVSWDGFMSKLARVLPEDVWLNSLQFAATAPAAPVTPDSSGTTGAPAAPAPTTGALPTGFTIGGYTYSQASVARLIRRLRLLPWLSDVQLQNSNLTTVGERSVYQFSIVGGVNALPAKEAS
jgi:Tfp pilus assembly protein PilN